MVRASSLILQNRDGAICLIRRDDDPSILFPSRWNVIGGALEPGETPEGAVVRECLEEVGLRIPVPQPFMRFATEWHEEHVFRHRLAEAEPAIVLGEGTEYRFVAADVVPTLATAFYTGPICALFRLAFPSEAA